MNQDGLLKKGINHALTYSRGRGRDRKESVGLRGVDWFEDLGGSVRDWLLAASPCFLWGLGDQPRRRLLRYIVLVFIFNPHSTLSRNYSGGTNRTNQQKCRSSCLIWSWVMSLFTGLKGCNPAAGWDDAHGPLTIGCQNCPSFDNSKKMLAFQAKVLLPSFPSSCSDTASSFNFPYILWAGVFIFRGGSWDAETK